MNTRRPFADAVRLCVAAMMIFVSTGLAAPQETEQTSTRAAMRGLFVVLSKLYRYSLDANAFADPANRPEIKSLLDALVQNTAQLEAHGGGLDPSFDLVRRSLIRDAREALESFKSTNYVGSRFILGGITENCVTCHTKLPAERPFEAGQEFLDAINVKEFPPAARARLQVATRQFSDAMKTYEDVMLSPTTRADDLGPPEVFSNYFRISIGALNDIKRPVPVLQEFIRRPDMPEAVKAESRAWIASLEALNLAPPKGGELAAARGLVEEARKKTTSASDRSRLVDFIGSIALAHRYVRSGPKNDVSAAEAYYLLGVAESYVSRSYWISETEYLLEKSIRQAPKSEVAKQALAFLEAYRGSEYYVTPARAVPPDLQTNLDQLRELTKQ